MAVPWADAVINPCNARWSATEIAYSLDDWDTRVLLVDDSAGCTPATAARMDDEGFPMSGTGKVLKRTLREPHWEGQERQVA